ncbi:MAG TPA: penicillin-binding protein 1C [Acidisphaera sp.]|nr:penicillin-binding protein 1C [Acidisphaera sp.]
MQRRWLALAFPLLLAAAAWGLDRAFPPDLHRLDVVGTEVLDRNGRPLALLPAPGGVWRFAAAPADVSPAFLDLLIRTEDRRFWLHPGVDPVAIVRAAAQMLRAGHVVSGGSTLAMQAARLLEPRPRTLRSKLIEAARALQLEWRYGRQGVLRIWLTLAPYGGDLEGVRAGSLAWFGREPSALEPDEAALLVAIPRRPEALRPDRHHDAAQALRDRILGPAGVADASPVPAARTPLPRHAPQIVAGLARAHPGQAQIATTVDVKLQTALERLAADRLRDLPPRESLAIVVADAASREIRAAYAGAWRDPDRAGALDLTRAIRSPGSALKPFIYALAFEDGIVGPQTQLADLPRLFGTYAPENFDRGFAGGITAAEALRQSLNLPAVALLDRIGPLRFVEALRDAGAPLRLPRGAAPSLPLALGGGGTTLRDAAGLYAALATDGTARPLTLIAGDTSPSHAFLQQRAAATVANVLTRPLPGATRAAVAWKTGTSWGGRDAWAFGFDTRDVVGVWVGRPDGTPVAQATGAATALPILGSVFDLLPHAPRSPTPLQAEQRDVNAPALGEDNLRLLFPPPGAVLGADSTVTIRAMGGQRPLTFLVDGAPIASMPVRRETTWTPPGPGFYLLTVLDAEGEAAHANIRAK